MVSSFAIELLFRDFSVGRGGGSESDQKSNSAILETRGSLQDTTHRAISQKDAAKGGTTMTAATVDSAKLHDFMGKALDYCAVMSAYAGAVSAIVLASIKRW